MFELSVVVALIVAVGQVAKKYIPKKFMPLVSLGLGVIAGFTGFIPADTIQEQILYGVAIGLTANGTFDLSKIPKAKK